jgi:cyclophilin family peptidyl-prolyl cis-trans isomerase
MRPAIFTALALGSLVFTSCADDRAGVGSDRKNDTKVAENKVADAKNPVVVLETSMGTIKIQLDDGHAPNTVKNFLRYVDEKFYDGTIFHRVIEDFMIQGGGFTPELKDAKSITDIQASQKKTHDPIKNEAPNGLSNVRGTIAMARTGAVNSATAQFYINVDDSRRRGLDDPGSPYCVFGKVIDGMDVVDKIREVKTKAIVIQGQIMEGVPAEDVLIKSVRRADK